MYGLVILALSTVPPTTIPAPGGGGRDWFDWTQYAGVQIAAAAAVVALVAAWIALKRTRTDCGFGQPISRAVGPGRIFIVIPIHIVPGGASFVEQKKKRMVSFKRNGVEIDWVERQGIPERSDREYRNELQYEMAAGGPVDVTISVVYKDGGKSKLSERVEPPPLQ